MIGLNPVIDKAMASWLDTGSVSILQYADRLYYIPVTLVYSGLVVVILSRWSDKYYKTGDINGLKKDVGRMLGLVGIIAVLMTIVLSAFSGQIVRLAYGRGEFAIDLLQSVRKAFLLYLGGVTFVLFGNVIVRGHLVLKNTKTLLITAVISCVFNILLNLALMGPLGVGGLALSTSITAVITFVYLGISFIVICGKKSKEKGSDG